MANRRSRMLRFYEWEVIFGIEVSSDIYRKIFRLLEDALFSEFKTNAVIMVAYADENKARLRIKVDPGNQSKLINLITMFCREQKLLSRQGDKQ